MIFKTKLHQIHFVLCTIFLLSASFLSFGQLLHETCGQSASNNVSTLYSPPCCFSPYESIHRQELTPTLEDSNITVVGRWAWGICVAVAVQDSHAYIGNGALFQVYDVSHPSFPEFECELLTTGIIQDIAVSGQLAYVLAGRELMVLDISMPNNPTKIGRLKIDLSLPWVVAISGNYAYVGTFAGYLFIVDISNPENPKMVGGIPTGGDQVRGLAIRDTYVYVGNLNGAYIRIIDVSEPEDPYWAGKYPIGSAVEALTISKNHLYVGTSAIPSFQILDITNPTDPRYVSGLETVDDATDIEIVGTYCFHSSRSRFSVISLSDINNPREVANLERKWPLSAVVKDGHAYIATVTGFWIVEIIEPMEPEEVSFIPTGEMAYKVAVSGSYAYVADGEAGLWILDISIPTEPSGVGHFDTEGYARDVAVSGQHVCVVTVPSSIPGDTSGAVWIVDVSDPMRPRELGRFRGIIHFPHSWYVPNALDVSEDLVFVTQPDSGLSIIDISDPEHPYQTGFLSGKGYVYDVTVSDRYCYLAENEHGLRIVDISDPSGPKEIGLWAEVDTRAVTIVGNSAYVAAKSGLSILDVSIPNSPVETGYVPTNGGRSNVDMAVSAGYAYMAYGSGLQVIDVSEPSQPRVVGYFGPPDQPDGVATDDDYIYLAARLEGLWILQNNFQTSVHEDADLDVSPSFTLLQNYPNPFNPVTEIRYRIADHSIPAHTILKVFNILGQEVISLVDETRYPGFYTVTWDGNDGTGAVVASGIYFYSLSSGDYQQTRRMILAR